MSKKHPIFATVLLLATVAASPAWAWDKPECLRDAQVSLCYTGQPVSGGKTGGAQVFAIAIVRNAQGVSATVSVFDRSWSMPTRKGLELTVSVDAYQPARVQAGTSGHTLSVYLPVGDLALLSRASVFHLTSPMFTESYDLAGSRRAIEALGEAWRRHDGGAVATTSDPFAGQSAPAADPLAEPVRRWGT